MAHTAIVIPNWNGRLLLAECLAALEAQTWRDFEIVVVDNGSTDGSVEWIRKHAPTVRVIVNAENVGFAAAINQGIQSTHSCYVVALNNDTRPEPTWLEEMLRAAEANPRVGMVACKMLFADEPGVINSTGICVDRAALAWDRRGGELDDASAPGNTRELQPVEVFGPCGGAALYRRAMLDEIGFLDQDFFAYFEDVDLAWRAQLAGWRCLYAPSARVLHRHSATSLEGSPFKYFQQGRNKIWLMLKNYPWPAGMLYLPVFVFYDLGTLPYRRLLRGDWSALRGRWAALWHWRVAWHKRRAVNRWPEYMSPLSALWCIHARARHVAQRAVQ
jgi:GT2 family glycosyltransferase